MPSGYEKSPDYGGPQPKLWMWVALVIGIFLVYYLLL